MSVSVLIPTYNRRKFSELISLNIRKQTYPFIKEIIVADDGDNSERLVLDVPYSVLYYKVPRMSIGEKRNFLISKSSCEYVAHMDTDDIYNPDYLSKSIFNLIKTGKNVSGSADMLMYNLETKKTYGQKCIYLDLLNEATMVYKKTYTYKHKYSNTMSSEGLAFLTGALAEIIETDIDSLMVCLCHSNNTVSKQNWCSPEYEQTIDMSKYTDHLEIISKGNI